MDKVNEAAKPDYIKFAMEAALSDFRWIERTVPNSNFQASILGLETAIKEYAALLPAQGAVACGAYRARGAFPEPDRCENCGQPELAHPSRYTNPAPVSAPTAEAAKPLPHGKPTFGPMDDDSTQQPQVTEEVTQEMVRRAVFAWDNRQSDDDMDAMRAAPSAAESGSIVRLTVNIGHGLPLVEVSGATKMEAQSKRNSILNAMNNRHTPTPSPDAMFAPDVGPTASTHGFITEPDAHPSASVGRNSAMTQVDIHGWPPESCVRALVDAATHLLDDHNCDTDQHERFIAAKHVAESWLAALRQQPAPGEAEEAAFERAVATYDKQFKSAMPDEQLTRARHRDALRAALAAHSLRAGVTVTLDHDSDGDVSFEVYRDRNTNILLSVGPKGFNWAALVNGESSNGVLAEGLHAALTAALGKGE